MALAKRSTGGDSPEGGGDQDLRGEVAGVYSNIAEFLALGTWPDGSARQLGTLLVCCEDGRYKCWINDKDAGLSAWVSAGSLQDLWDAVDAILGGKGHEWRRTKPQGPKGGKGR